MSIALAVRYSFSFLLSVALSTTLPSSSPASLILISFLFDQSCQRFLNFISQFGKPTFGIIDCPDCIFALYFIHFCSYLYYFLLFHVSLLLFYWLLKLDAMLSFQNCFIWNVCVFKVITLEMPFYHFCNDPGVLISSISLLLNSFLISIFSLTYALPSKLYVIHRSSVTIVLVKSSLILPVVSVSMVKI